MKNNIKSKLQSLERWELNILARKLGMRKESKSNIPVIKILQNWYYSLRYRPGETDFIENIALNPQNKKIVRQFLDINSRLKALDESKLRQLTREIEIKETGSDKKSVLIKNILNDSEHKGVIKKLNLKRLLLFRGLTTITIVFLLTYLVILNPSRIIIGAGEVLKLFGGWLGGIASIVGFFLIFSPETNWKDRIINCWITNRLDLIVVLLFYICYTHPDKDLVALMGGLASTASILLTVVPREFFDIWRERHFYKTYYAIIVILAIGAIYIEGFIISGYVYFEKENKPIIGAEVKLKEPPRFCKRKNQIKRFCEAKTNSEGKFYILLIPFRSKMKDIEVEVIYDNKSRGLYKIDQKHKKIYITNLLTGTWKYKDKEEDATWRIEHKGANDLDIIVEESSIASNKGKIFNGKYFSGSNEFHFTIDGSSFKGKINANGDIQEIRDGLPPYFTFSLVRISD